jgi:hypothetical protein
MTKEGVLVKDEPVVIHCYTTPVDVQNSRKLVELASFCRMMGRDARQGEIGVIIGASTSPSATLGRSNA